MKNASNVLKVVPKNKNPLESKYLKTLKDLPALPEYPIIGHTHLFLPGGIYKTERLTEAVQDISKKLGPIFRLNLGGINIVCTVDAAHAETLCRNEGKYPIRPPFPALSYYRKKAFDSVGVVPGNGQEWYKFRQGVNPLLQLPIVHAYQGIHEKVALRFIRYIRNHRDKHQIVENIFEHLLRFTIEAISVVTPGIQFDCLSGESTKSEDIIKASIDFMDGLYNTLLGPPLWKLFRTSGYKKLESSHTTIYGIMKDCLLEANNLNNSNPDSYKQNSPFMSLLLDNKNFSNQDKSMLAMEIFLGGIDATATTIAITLHYLSNNNNVQDTAYKESITNSSYNLPYLRACIKETLRLCPTAGANSRFTIHDTQLGEYMIPKNTLVSAFGSVTSLNKEYFPNPDEYKPDRWLRGADVKQPFASLPFGFGARMCPGRRIAEQEMIILLRQVLTCYKLEPVSEETIGMVFRMNRIADRPINIKFIDRT